jgi:hypothetical protein
MKKTATDWMFDQLWETPKDKLAWFKILMEAKKMEKEQIMEAASIVLWTNNSNSIVLAEKYYKETYEKK